MAADVVALGAALVATKIATRPDDTGRRTYGSYRAEVFASGFTVLVMLGVSVLRRRRGGTPDRRRASRCPRARCWSSAPIGLVVNLVCLALLRGGAQESINVKGAYLEVMADAAGSVGVIVAGVLVGSPASGLWDTVVAVAIGVFVAVRAVLLGREVLAVLGQHAPEGSTSTPSSATSRRSPGVAEVHDLHAWTLTSGMNVATAHLVTGVGADAQAVLAGAQADAARGPRHRARDAAGRGHPGPGVPRGHVVSDL